MVKGLVRFYKTKRCLCLDVGPVKFQWHLLHFVMLLYEISHEELMGRKRGSPAMFVQYSNGFKELMLIQRTDCVYTN